MTDQEIISQLRQSQARQSDGVRQCMPAVNTATKEAAYVKTYRAIGGIK